jgi:hypothetical protein
MKTRIRIVEFGDGIVRYYPEAKFGVLKTLKNDVVNYENTLAVVVFFPVFFFVSLISCLFWKPLYMYELDYFSDHGESVFLELERAKKVIDDLLIEIENERQAKLKQKMSEKVIKETYLKHP